MKSLRPRLTLGKATAAALLATAAFQGMSYGQLLKIGVSFVGRGSDQFLAIDDSAGVFAQQDWNNLKGNTGITGNTHDGNQFQFADGGNGPFTSQALFTDNGTAGTLGTSAVTFSVGAQDSWNSDGPTATPNDKLMKGIVKANNNQNTVDFTLNNLTPGVGYKFLAYGQENGNTGDVNFTLAGDITYSTYFVRQSSNFDGTFTQGTSTDAANRTTGVDYVQWDTVFADATGKLKLTMFYAGNGGDGAGLSGFQLLELPPTAGPDKFYNGGAGTGTWDLVTQNWRSLNTNGASDATFATNDKANFGDLGTAGARTVNVDAAGVTAGQINVNNSAANPYTISGGPILGAGSPFTKDGAGSLTLTGANEFSGAVTIKHGTVNVSTIGGPAAAGNLGKGGSITLGDAGVGANDAKLNYTGSTASYGRSLVMGDNGGEIAITTAAETLTLTGSFTGTGGILKSGPGGLSLPSTGGTGFTGGITVTGGSFSVGKLAAGAAGTNVSNGATFNYNGATLTDGRGIVIGAGNGTIGVGLSSTRYEVPSLTATAGNLTVAGNGRLAVSGIANFANVPTISNGATLALTNEGGTNVLPSTIAIPSGTLTLAPGSFAAGENFTLTGGTLRFGHEGLQGDYFTGAGNQPIDLVATSSGIAGYFGGQTPVVSNRTTFAGRTNLDFSNANFGGGAPFADQGFGDSDQLRAYFAGKILITNAGQTDFFTSSDDGSVLYIDGIRIVNNNAFQGANERTGSVNLTAGLHDIQIGFYEGGGGAGLTVSYTPQGGTKQIIPNSVLFAGDVNTSGNASVITVAQDSTFEVAAKSASVAGVVIAAGKTLTVSGSADFSNTSLAGAAGINVASNLGVVSLGSIVDANRTITKTGVGALLFGAAGVPTGTIINDNNGLIVLRATDSGGGQSVNPLVNATINFAGGGLGFTAGAGNVNALTFTNNLVSADNYGVEAGRFGGPVQTVAVNYAPANNSLAVASGKTATYAARGLNYTLNVNAPVTGAGSVNVEEGAVNFTSIANTGGLTVGFANVNVSGAINTGGGAVTLQGTGLGLNLVGLNESLRTPSLVANGGLTATGVTVNRGALTVNGSTVNSGALTLTAATANQPLTAGSATFNGTSSHTSVTVNGGSLTATGQFTNSGAFTQTNGATTLAGSSHASINVGAGTFRSGTLTTTGSITGSGSTALTFTGNVSGSTATNLTHGATATFDPGTGTTATYTGADINLNNLAAVNVGSGTVNLSGAAIHAPQRIGTSVDNSLLGRLFVLGADFDGTIRLDPRNQAEANTIYNGGTPNAQAVLTGALDFPNDNAFTTFFGIGQPGTNNFTAGFAGHYVPSVTGTTSFRTAFNDDQAAVWIDVNNNGTFDSNEKVLDVGNCCGPSGYGTSPLLTAGVSYNILFAVQDTGGGGTLAIDLNTDNNRLNPSAASQSGQFYSGNGNNAGGNIRVDQASNLQVKSFDGIYRLALNGANANAATVTLPAAGSATADSADILAVTGAAGSSGVVSVGANHTLTAGMLELADSSTLQKTGPGALIVSGSVVGTLNTPSTFVNNSSVTVSGGTFLMNATSTGTGSVTAAAGGTVGGSGTVPSLAATGGTISPGAAVGSSIGTLSTAGGVTLDAASTFRLELNPATAATDVLNVTGSVSLGNSSLAVLTLAIGGNVNDVFYVILNDGADAVTGTFAGRANNSTFAGGSGYTFRIRYDADSATGGLAGFTTPGNDVALQIVSVPEPGTIATLMGGFGLLAGLQRFRRRRE